MGRPTARPPNGGRASPTAAVAAVGLAGTASAADGEINKGVIMQTTPSYTARTITSEPVHLFREGDVVDVLCVASSATPDEEGRLHAWFGVAPSKPIGAATTAYVPASLVQPSDDAPPVQLHRC